MRVNAHDNPMKYGRYEIRKELGRGSMGVVYEAHDPQIDRTVALKVLRQDRHATDTFVKRFLKEAKAIGRLSHPNIVTIYDAGEDRGTIFIAMEYLEGVPLNHLIETKRFSVDEVLDIGIQICETLDYAHGKGVIHRDIKPSNILVQAKGRVKITDFGIAHIEDPSATLQTQDGEILGTPAYMSPEQVLGKAIDGRSDLFSVGVILYELSTGSRPFGRSGRTLATLFNEITHATPPSPGEINPDMDPDLARVIMKCLSKDPVDRYPTGEAAAEALRACRKHREDQASMSAGETVHIAPPAEPTKSRRSPFFLLLLLAVVLGGGLYAFYPDPLLNLFRQRTTVTLDVTSTTKPKPLLKLASVPSGADVFLNDQAKGKTPLEVELEPGRHAVRASLAGYEDWTGEVRLEEAKPYNVQIEMKPKRALAFVNVESEPPGAAVSVDGRTEGNTPLGLELPLGQHTIRLVLGGYEDWQSPIALAEEREYPVRVTLKPISVPKTATLKVVTLPPGAAVSVNGEPRGVSPVEIPVPLGRHQVVTRLEGYQERREVVDAAQARVYPLGIELQPAMRLATLRILSRPPGADVFIDGLPKGQTPLSTEVQTGPRMVRVSLPDHEYWTDWVHLEEPKEYTIDADLKPIVREALLLFESTPSAVDVLVDGESRGQTPLEVKIAPGEHVLSMMHPDFENWQERVQVEAGRRYPFKVSLKPLARQSLLAVTSNPPKATVFVDGLEVGKTPLQVKLPPGSRKLRVSLPHHLDWEKQVLLSEGKEHSVTARLTPEKTKQTTRQTDQTPPQTKPTRQPGTGQGTDDGWIVGPGRDIKLK